MTADEFEKHRGDAQQRVLALLKVLAGHEVVGLTLTEVKAQGGYSADAQALRDLANLALAGFAEKLETGRWRLAPAIVQIAVQAMHAFEAAQRKLDDSKNRFTRQFN